MASVVCFLCQADVTSGTMLSKRRKIPGPASEIASNILDELSQKFYHEKVSSTCQESEETTFICQKRQKISRC